MPDDPIPATIAWGGDCVRLIDQRRLPQDLVIVEVATVDELCELIATLAVRGAPALGAAGAMGVALAHVRGESVDDAAPNIAAAPGVLGGGLDPVDAPGAVLQTALELGDLVRARPVAGDHVAAL